MKLMKLLEKLKEPTRHCKICFEEIKTNNLHSFLCKNQTICEKCLRKLEPKFIKFKVSGYSGLSIYDYDQEIQTYLFQFKGCYDIEIREFFLCRWANELRFLYKGFYIIPIPSAEIENKKREFNHVVEIFSLLQLPMLNVLEKTENIKQSSRSQKDRKEIEKILILSNVECIRNKRILLVDDVFTTGSTMTAAIKLVAKHKPKEIKVLVMSKTVFVEKK